MRKLLKKLARGERGFTLIELVVVIAILGVLAAVATPLIVNYLSQAKERAYNSDVKVVQAAVDAYYSEPGNEKFTGKRQYPILGIDNKSSTLADLLSEDDTVDLASTDLVGTDPLATPIPHMNPLGGTVGGDPVWTDDGDGIRSGGESSIDEENLNGPTVPTPVVGWHVAEAPRQAKKYYVDSRDFIIDMRKLVNKGLLEVPASAAADNCPTLPVQDPPLTLTCDGGYIYYIDSAGKVKTLLATFPTSTKVGFLGVFP